MDKLPVIAIVGATASGKTSLAVGVAKRFNGEVISADSMQIYKGMSIATAKPTPEEMQEIPHHLIDFLPVTEKYSVARFTKQAAEIISDVARRGKTPVVCGGTGLYTDSLLYGMTYEDEPYAPEIRAELEKRRDENGMQALYDELKNIDPDYAAALHINNGGRIIRALEMYYLTGETPSVRRGRAVSGDSPYSPCYISIEYKNRENLYARIDKRVELMLENGLVREAEEYFALDKKSTASQAIGYKELAGYFSGELTLPEAVENLKRATRRYAKRQLTWFRRNADIHRIYADDLPEGSTVLDEAEKILIENGYEKMG